MKEQEIRKALRAAATKRAKADQLRGEATKMTVAALKAGLAADLPKSEMADLLSMSRPALYELMERHKLIRLGRHTRSSDN